MGSLVTWGFDTDVTEGVGFVGGILGRYFGLFLDRWVGKDYEQGLADLKGFAESLPAGDFSSADIGVVDAQPIDVLMVSGEAAQEPEAIAAALAEAYGEVMSAMRATGGEPTGQPLAITRAWEDSVYRFDAAIPTTLAELPPGSMAQLGQTPTGRAVRIVHIGPYEDTNDSYAQASAYMAAHGLTDSGVSWEHYISDPGVTPSEEIVTHIYFLLSEASSP